ncbi:two-component system phosphate regulon sensor histidine kinase PhoR [Limnobacter thiooxidans]|uniref:Phosphate regulon sensor protein PhoR n=1 Tax=Limnobacter thiooxidans TaxID=131080 RepID=A0AA86JGX9_9BURK|nr:two-component system phosphate regulon sensor histidine kinase PhoR [Limnobacter thiooxidans]BET26901.1 phosphate regulon sensor histidine kinase PhoR [Limnobacter thiooxidans]
MAFILFRLFVLALVLGAAAIAGQMIAGPKGAVAGSILASLIVYALHVRSGLKIIDWLDDFKVENVPDVSGWWDDLAAKLFRYLRLHQRQQQALTNALVSFRTAAQALPDGVVTLDSEGHISWCNDTAQDHLGLRLGSDIGQPLINLVRNPNFSQYIRSRQWEHPLVMTAPRSRSKVLSVQLVSYGDQQMLVLSRDVTQVEKLERMRRDFIANVSHELKTPLTVLSGFLETFRDLPLSKEQQAEYLNLMYTQANRMQNLVEDLLALSALESSPSAESGELVDLSGIAQKTGDEAQQLSGGKHDIRVEVETGLFAMGNTAEIFSAFSNIVTNAIRYTPERGKISIALRKTENEIGKSCAAFVVQDTGIGVSAEHIPRLTERFYRVDRSRSRESGGTGLGLAIVKHVVQRHDGELDIQSRPNAGSTFTILMPLAKLEAAPKSAAAQITTAA